MLRDSRIEALQFRDPKPSLRDRPSRDFSEKLEVVRVQLLKHCNRASCPYKVNASGCRVILEIVGAAHAVQPLNHFSRLRIDDGQPPGFMLMSASNVAGVCYQSAANKQAMMGRVQACGVRHRASGDWPLGDHGAFFEIDDRNVAFPIHDVSHSDVQSFSRWLDRDACGITSRELDAARQFGRSCVNDVDRGTAGSVLTAATKVFKDFDACVNQMGGRIIRGVVRPAVRIAVSRQSNGLGNLVRSPANRYNTAVCQGHPDFVGLREIERLFGHRREPFCNVNHLARAEVHSDKGLFGLARNKYALALDVNCEMVHVAIPWQWDGLNQPQKSRHMHHGQLLAIRLLTLRFRYEGHQQNQENREKPFHFLSPHRGISTYRTTW